MANDDIGARVQQFTGLAGAADEAARVAAEALFEEMAPGILNMHAEIPTAVRSQAVIVVADTQHSIAASVARAVVRHVPSAASMLPKIGTGVVWFAQPRAIIDILFDAFGIPVPAHWVEPPVAGVIRLAFLLEDGLLYATDFTPSPFASNGGSA